MNTDEHGLKNKIMTGWSQTGDDRTLLFLAFDFLFLLLLSVLIRVHPRFRIGVKKKSRRAFHPRVWCWAGYSSPRCMAAQPGGMTADILLAHYIAAAKVRRQSR